MFNQSRQRISAKFSSVIASSARVRHIFVLVFGVLAGAAALATNVETLSSSLEKIVRHIWQSDLEPVLLDLTGRETPFYPTGGDDAQSLSVVLKYDGADTVLIDRIVTTLWVPTRQRMSPRVPSATLEKATTYSLFAIPDRTTEFTLGCPLAMRKEDGGIVRFGIEVASVDHSHNASTLLIKVMYKHADGRRGSIPLVIAQSAPDKLRTTSRLLVPSMRNGGELWSSFEEYPITANGLVAGVSDKDIRSPSEKELLSLKWPEISAALAESSTSPETLRELASSDTGLSAESIPFLFYANPATPPDAMRKLLPKDRYITWALYRKVDVSSEDLQWWKEQTLSKVIKRAKEAGQAKLSRPLLDGKRAEAKECSEEWPEPAVRGLYALDELLPYADTLVFDTIIRSDAEALYPWLAKNGPLNVVVNNGFVGHPASDIREAVAKRTDLPVTFVEALAKDGCAKVRLQIAKREALPERIIRTLARDAETEVRAAIARTQTLPDDVLDELAKDTEQVVVLSLARNRALPSHIQTSLVEGASTAVLSVLVNEHDLTPEQQEKLVSRLQIERVTLIARSTEEVDRDWFERWSLDRGNSRHDPQEVVERLRILESLASDRALAPSVAERLLRFGRQSLVNALAENPSTPEGILQQVMAYAPYRVGNNPSASEPVLKALLASGSVSGAVGVADNLSATAGIIGEARRKLSDVIARRRKEGTDAPSGEVSEVLTALSLASWRLAEPSGYLRTGSGGQSAKSTLRVQTADCPK